jgi:hypothetical protein
MSFKTGDKAMVTINHEPNVRGHYAISDGRGNLGYVGERYLSPLPATISPEAQAVLDAALAWYTPSPEAGTGRILSERVTAYRASIAPSDPIADLITQARDAMTTLALNSLTTDATLLSNAIEAAERSRT